MTRWQRILYYYDDDSAHRLRWIDQGLHNDRIATSVEFTAGMRYLLIEASNVRLWYLPLSLRRKI
jgi:hypothetical protein